MLNIKESHYNKHNMVLGIPELNTTTGKTTGLVEFSISNIFSAYAIDRAVPVLNNKTLAIAEIDELNLGVVHLYKHKMLVGWDKTNRRTPKILCLYSLLAVSANGDYVAMLTYQHYRYVVVVYKWDKHSGEYVESEHIRLQIQDTDASFIQAELKPLSKWWPWSSTFELTVYSEYHDSTKENKVLYKDVID